MKKTLIILLLVTFCSCNNQKAKDSVREFFKEHYSLFYNHKFIDISKLESCTDRDLKYYLLDYYNNKLELFKGELAGNEVSFKSANETYVELRNVNDEWALEHKKYLQEASGSSYGLIKKYQDSIKCVKEKILKLSSLEVDGKKKIMQKTTVIYTVIYNDKNSKELWDVYLDKDLKVIEHEHLLVLGIQKFIDPKATKIKICD